MTIKLLPKSEIDHLKAEERRKEVEEGRKIAERIDTLRETVSEEEAALGRFRVETVTRINAEISAKITEREELEHGNSKLRREREELLKPLDTEREEIRLERIHLAQWEKSISEKEDQVIQREESSIECQKEVEKRLQRAKIQEEIIGLRLSEANRAAKASEDAYIVAEEVKQATISERKAISIGLTHREEAVSARENNATIRESDIASREKEIGKEHLRLADQEATLARAFNRLKK